MTATAPARHRATKSELLSRRRLSPAERFFYDQAGYSYGPNESPEQGHQRSARQLAAAEQRASDVPGLVFSWEEDDQPFECGCDDPVGCPSHEPHQAYGCVLRHHGTVVESLWGISFGPGNGPAGEPYARVVEAELALEYFRGLDKIADVAGPDPFGLDSARGQL